MDQSDELFVTFRVFAAGLDPATAAALAAAMHITDPDVPRALAECEAALVALFK